jgi:hypothetical protein
VNFNTRFFMGKGDMHLRDQLNELSVAPSAGKTMPGLLVREKSDEARRDGE